MKNKILLVGLFCCSLVSTEAQVLLDKNAGKNSFPIVSPAANVVVCFDGKDETVVRKSVTLFADDVRRVTGQDLKHKQVIRVMSRLVMPSSWELSEKAHGSMRW